eukprot:2108926-Amphidinium_carterae.2
MGMDGQPGQDSLATTGANIQIAVRKLVTKAHTLTKHLTSTQKQASKLLRALPLAPLLCRACGKAVRPIGDKPRWAYYRTV